MMSTKDRKKSRALRHLKPFIPWNLVVNKKEHIKMNNEPHAKTSNGENIGINKNEMARPPARLPTDSQTYTHPISRLPFPRCPMSKRQATGKIKPTIKLKEHTEIRVPLAM
jgi:hypothetical protein